MIKAPVNKIIEFSNVDGPSNRTSIFFQSCNFNCRYCHNPETIHYCVGCGTCVKNCPVQALRFEGKNVVWDSEKCVGCDTCIKVCPNNASPKITWMTVDDVAAKLEETRPYIKGITTSGGECTLQKDFLVPLFDRAHEMGLTCFVDSNGSTDFEANPALTNALDMVMLDVKAFDPARHRDLCGVDNAMVIKNLHYLLKIGKLWEVRTVILPGQDELNTDTVTKTAEIIGDRCIYKIIRYRPFGVRESMIPYLSEDLCSEEEAQHYVDLAKAHGASQARII